MIFVAAALVKKDGKFLIAKRIEGDAPSAHKWEFPGGKIEPGELAKDAIKRELKEELAIDVKVVKYLTDVTYEYPTRTINIKLFECEYISGDIKLNVHSDYKFISFEDLLKYELCPADRLLAEQISRDNYD